MICRTLHTFLFQCSARLFRSVSADLLPHSIKSVFSCVQFTEHERDQVDVGCSHVKSCEVMCSVQVVHVSLSAEEMKMQRKMARQMRREQRQLKREEHERLRQEIAAADGWQDAIGQLIEAFRCL